MSSLNCAPELLHRHGIALRDLAPLEAAAAEDFAYNASSDTPSTPATTRLGHKYLLNFSTLAAFIISRDGRTVAALSYPGTSRETFNHLLLDKVLPLALSLQDQLVLHAGAVSLGGEGIGLLGRQGAGKSTLTSYLHLAGHPLLCDDALIVAEEADRIVGKATYASLRLMPDSVTMLLPEDTALNRMAQYSAKQNVSVTGAPHLPATPLKALYVLQPKAPDQPLGITRVSGRQACLDLIENSFSVATDDPNSQGELFRKVIRMVRSLPVFHLRFPHDYSRLEDVRQAILCHIPRLAEYGSPRNEGR